MQKQKTVLAGLVLLTASTGIATAHAADAVVTPNSTPVAYRPSATSASAPSPGEAARADQELVLTAPPRDTQSEGERRFGPLAEYLTRVLGRKVVYRHPVTWGAYQAEMLKGQYDLVFDAPHLNGWRVERLGHNVLVKVPGDYTYAAFVRSDNTKVTSISQLAGHKVCAHAPPHLGTLVLFNQFPNPLRQPAIVVTDGYAHTYEAVMAGKCEAAMLSLKHLKKFDKNGTQARIVFTNRSLPQQALSASPRLSAQEQTKVTEALLAPAGEAPLRALRESYGFGAGFVRTSNAEYAGLGLYLRGVWGYY
jgi:ABC-type phosphate/phosphonate transport system substrate-binding protein